MGDTVSSPFYPFHEEKEIESPLAYLLEQHQSVRESLQGTDPEYAALWEKQIHESANNLIEEARPEPGDKWYSYTHIVHALNAIGGIYLMRNGERVFWRTMWVS